MEHEGSRREYLEVLAEFDAPAYIRRAKTAHDAYDRFMSKCAAERVVRLYFPRLRLAVLAAQVAQDWATLDAIATLAVESGHQGAGAYLGNLFEQWRPTLRIPVPASGSHRRIRRSMRDLIHSMESFNQQWQRYVRELDFSQINAIREGYNNYYICEKAAALQSEKLATHGFQPLAAVGPEAVLSQYPALLVPRLK